MPQMSEEDFNKLIYEIFQNGIPLSLNRIKEDENEAKRNATKYIKTKELKKETPLTMYYIINLLNENEKISFIKEHINYIKEHDEEVFLYTMLSPVSLSYYFTLNNIKELYQLDKDIFRKVITYSYENLFHGFTHEDYIEFYKYFKEEINKIPNQCFINSLYYHNRCCYDSINIEDVNNRYTLQQVYNKEFLDIILKDYEDKINSFNEKEIRYFLEFINDIIIYEKIIKRYIKQLSKSFEIITKEELTYYLSEQSDIKQEILFKYFKDIIVTKENIKEIISKLSPSIILDLYNNKKELFKEFTLKDWVQLTSKKRVLSKEFKEIIDSYEIDNIEELFDIKFYVTTYYRESVDSLKYVEEKYRRNLNQKKLNKIKVNTSIFSKEYLENLNYLKVNNIKQDSIEYKVHFLLFLEYIKLFNIDEQLNNVKELEILFKRIVSGSPISLLFEIKSVNEIALINRLGDIDFDPNDFTIEQLKKYNVKKHKQLNTIVNSDLKYKSLTLKLMFILGFNNAKKLLEYNNDVPVLEHLVGNIDVRNVKLDKQGEPIINKRVVNMLLNDNKIKLMLENKDSDLYKYFPRIFNEWEMIKLNGKDKNLNMVIGFLKGDEISLPPKYYRLEGLFKHIGCKNTIIQEAVKLHDEMLKRTTSTIPRVTGSKDEYTYEILKYDDMISLAVGNITDCCFTVLGVGYECLKHALTSKNGRIFVIKKDNEIIAHSWVWRNGNHLCFDNIELSKKINKIDFLELYIEASNKIIEETNKKEQSGITNISIGFTNFDKRIIGIEKYPCIVNEQCDITLYKDKLGLEKIITSKMPTPIEIVNYSDSKNVQFFIKGNLDIKSYQSSFYYEDKRRKVLHYNDEEEYEKNYIVNLMKIINSLRYIKYEKEDKIKEFEMISLYDIKEIHCNSDWYYIEYNDGYIEIFDSMNDIRSEKEIKQIEKIKKLQIK